VREFNQKKFNQRQINFCEDKNNKLIEHVFSSNMTMAGVDYDIATINVVIETIDQFIVTFIWSVPVPPPDPVRS
jgi:hypothetical protein